MYEKLKVAVCDDEWETLEMVSREIKRVFRRKNFSVFVTEYSNERSLFQKIIAGEKYDVIFLDIDMPFVNGIQLAVNMRQAGINTLLIFVSNMEGHVYDSFAAKPFRFIRKSVFMQEMEHVAEDIIQELQMEDEGILFGSGNHTIHLNPYRIMYVECKGKILDIHYENRVIELSYQISAMEEQLKEYGFIRVHKGYLVNYRFIFKINKEELVLDDQSVIPVSRLRMNDVRSQYRRLTI